MHTDGQTDKQTNRQTNKQTDRREPKPISGVIGFAIAQPIISIYVHVVLVIIMTGINGPDNFQYVLVKEFWKYMTFSDISINLLLFIKYSYKI